MPRPFLSQRVRQAIETVAILAPAGIVHDFWRNGAVTPWGICWLVTGLDFFLLSDFISLKDALRRSATGTHGPDRSDS